MRGPELGNGGGEGVEREKSSGWEMSIQGNHRRLHQQKINHGKLLLFGPNFEANLIEFTSPSYPIGHRCIFLFFNLLPSLTKIH